MSLQGEGNLDTDTQGEGNMKTEAKIGVMHLEAKECWQPLESRRAKGKFYLESQSGYSSGNTLLLGF